MQILTREGEFRFSISQVFYFCKGFLAKIFIFLCYFIVPQGRCKKLLREFCSAYKLSLGERLRNVTNPSPDGDGICVSTEETTKKTITRTVAPAGILLRLQALAGREAPQCYESLA